MVVAFFALLNALSEMRGLLVLFERGDVLKKREKHSKNVTRFVVLRGGCFETVWADANAQEARKRSGMLAHL